MCRLTEQAHELCRAVIMPGDVAIDATAGNGHDTLFLARQTGPAGMVYAFDVQEDAIHETESRLEREGLQNVILLQTDHAEMKANIPREQHGRVAAVMFNLGYLPGGDKSLITRPESTLPAIEQSLELLRPGGILTALSYIGHPGGAEETASVRDLLNALPADSYGVNELHGVENSSAPVLFTACKR